MIEKSLGFPFDCRIKNMVVGLLMCSVVCRDFFLFVCLDCLLNLNLQIVYIMFLKNT